MLEQRLRALPAQLYTLTVVLLIFPLFVQASKSNGASRWNPEWFCKCTCFDNYTILPILRPERPNKPCLTCTKQWCLDAKLEMCTNATLGDTNPDTATGHEGDVSALCFQRDRPLDQTVVTLFLLTIFGLLIGAAIKGQLDRFGVDLTSTGQRKSLWQSVIPGLGNERETMLDRIRNVGGRAAPSENGARRDGYAPLRDPDQDRGL